MAHFEEQPCRSATRRRYEEQTMTKPTTHMKKKKNVRNVQRVSQSQTAALPRHQEEEETDKTQQAQIEQTYKKH